MTTLKPLLRSLRAPKRRWRSRLMGRLSGLVLLALSACSEESEIIYDRFNATDEVFEVVVGATELGEVALLDLYSSTGAVMIGQASIDPDAGPSGTLHLIEVEILEDYVHQVDRVSVEIDSGARGVQVIDLYADSAAESVYRIEMESFSEEGEQRTDELEIQVWDTSGDADGES